jgi:hypothetical protein
MFEFLKYSDLASDMLSRATIAALYHKVTSGVKDGIVILTS